MRIVTWNVNSLKARLAFVKAWIDEQQPDVLLLQETKLVDAAFPAASFADQGYESAHHGNGRWNGVAILSRVGISDVRAGFFDEQPGDIDETRVVSATCGGVRVYSVYVPNGRVVDSEFYLAKLAWLAHLRADLVATCDPRGDVAVCGDFNVALTDQDVWDISKLQGMTHVTEPERRAVQEVLDWGLEDAVRTSHPGEIGPFSWWDYRAGSFHKGWGMRIDLALLSRPLHARLTSAIVDREARKVKGDDKPSDHAPVVIDCGARPN